MDEERERESKKERRKRRQEKRRARRKLEISSPHLSKFKPESEPKPEPKPEPEKKSNIECLVLNENDEKFYKVSWISPFNDKYTRFIEPGITAINKLYRKIIYKNKPYVVSTKTYREISKLKNPAELINININFNFTNTDEYISKGNLDKIKSYNL